MRRCAPYPALANSNRQTRLGQSCCNRGGYYVLAIDEIFVITDVMTNNAVCSAVHKLL